MPISVVSLYRKLFGRKGPGIGSDIDMAEHGRVGGVNTEQAFKYSRNVEEPLLIDEVDSNTTYVGATKQGSSGTTNTSIWQIKKIAVSGTVTTISYSDGNDDYDNIWDNRASLSYS